MNIDGSDMINLTLQIRLRDISRQPDGKRIFSSALSNNLTSELISINLDSLKQNITFTNQNIKFLADSTNSIYPICLPVKIE